MTPLSTFGQAVTGPVARRGMVVAASSGLAITMAASTAIASTDGTTTALPSVDVAALSGEARAALTTLSPSVAVPTDVEWSVEVAEAAATPPKAEVAAEPVAARVQEIEAEAAAQAAAEAEAIAEARAAEAASRTTARSAAPAAASGAAEAPAQAAQAAPAQNYSGGSIVDIAYRYVGTPYVWGGSTPSGFDCSGFTSYVFAQAGISLPRSSGAQRNAGTVVSASEARAGDLVWWPGHVGIYLGGGDYIAAHSVGNPLSARPVYKSNPTFIRVG